MRDGINVWGEVHDTVHWAHTPLGSRSRGFVWFFSFLAWYEDIKRQKQNVILLLDEPGLSLHGRAQADLLNYFEQELADRQLIYSTHSPFMIDPRNFEQVRIVQDLGIDANEQLPKDQDGTKVLTNVFDATDDSLFPLQGALGYEIHQTLFVGPNSLVVECPSDMLYLRAVSRSVRRRKVRAAKLIADGLWVDLRRGKYDPIRQFTPVACGNSRCRPRFVPTSRTNPCFCRRTCRSGFPQGTWLITSAMWSMHWT